MPIPIPIPKRPAIESATIIPWKAVGQWGIAIVYPDGREATYRVGTREQAEAEVKRLKTPQQWQARPHVDSIKD